MIHLPNITLDVHCLYCSKYEVIKATKYVHVDIFKLRIYLIIKMSCEFIQDGFLISDFILICELHDLIKISE